MPSSLIRFASLAAVLLTAQLTGRAQSVSSRGQPAGVYPPAGIPMQPYAMERMQVVDPDRKLSAGDQVTIEIVEDKEGGLPRVVTAAGAVDVPPLERVQVSGKTTAEAAADIKRKLEADYYYHATVRVSIDGVSRVQVRSGVVYLSGEVRQLGAQEIVAGETLTVSNAILKAGGFTSWAKRRDVQLTRQKAGATQVIKVDVQKIIETGDSKTDPILQDGDRINVPKGWIQF